MKVFGFRVLFSALILFLSFFTKGSTYTVPDMAFASHRNGMTMTATSRKLKDHGYTSSSDKSNAGHVNLEDYQPVDPVPSSKASIKPGPIEHGTPLMPYIPKPSPPGQPNHIVGTP